MTTTLFSHSRNGLGYRLASILAITLLWSHAALAAKKPSIASAQIHSGTSQLVITGTDLSVGSAAPTVLLDAPLCR